ncbi:TPA: ribonuclease R [Vibrio cholerae]|uniref:Ribonuclease R n=19 Tax=Gammaproteobacteria TaxID=1236 RepID=RNR_VIBCH|nr:ribonuclease R [Vibrio cholerae]Q9KNY1.1 RecName: Full=Ribonuclease R; Short=RNase R [Vibrio cholerae O1 biovar El Tor str. N16961]EEY48264.1 ribonuclease R [Vibrio cholerae INDRE 91/1]EYC48747.1 exoribonuclease R [Vibrio cholerae O1 biovar El Tor str. L-3226]MDG6206873.1 ribonuclease R [Vibrio sp. NO3-D2]AAF95740.1 ribonuclease R [Vibrio cholerae O1 biovar El Tor str. N16961]ACP06816.1 ribonuclease R [Vibrio cholerae M66-2]
MSDTTHLDPFADREADNYDNPIPSREYILEFLTQANVPMNRNDLFEALKLEGEEQYEGLRRRLRAMERDGQLVFTRRQCYALPEKLEMVKGYVIGHKDGHGWVRPEGSLNKEGDILLPHHQMRTLIHGDFVLVQPSGTDKRGRKEGRLVRILEERNGQIVGRFFFEYGYSYVVPDDSRIHHDILIPNDLRAGARMGNVVVIEITDRGTRNRGMMGKVVEVLGENMAPGMETQIAIRTHQIPHEWPAEVEQQVAGLTEEVPEEAKQGRVDLRALPLVTIDGEDARDFDDAVYCEAKKGGGWRLWVAIADVSYYVRPDTALDKEAINRGNSVYFPSQVVPMLPEVLSNGLCSLNPQVDRLCMVCEMTVSETGKLSGYKHYEAVMNSHARLTYTKVHEILEGDEELRERYKALVPHLEELHKMYQVLKSARDERGAIEFETVETKFIFNAQRKIESIEPVVRNDAHKLIEECMILANIASASLVEKAKEAALYRVHEPPGEERLTGFRDFLGELGLDLSGGLEPSPTDYANLMKQIGERPDKELIQTMLLRSMKQAVYNADNAGHFGLALKRYAHFTSPIRRYPDLLLHRAIKYLIAKQEGRNQDRWTPTGGYHYSFDDMDFYGEQCSMTERRADDATREVSDWLKCEYMQDHVGEELEGVVANVTSFGFFVRLTELHIDGLVHISTLANDYYHYDPIGQRLVGESFGAIYRLGDAVKVKVLAVNLDDRQIDFELVETSRKLRGQGKTAKKRADEARAKAQGKKEAATKGACGKSPTKSELKPQVEATRRPDSEGRSKPKKTKAPKKRKDQARKKSGKVRDKTK